MPRFRTMASAMFVGVALLFFASLRPIVATPIDSIRTRLVRMDSTLVDSLALALLHPDSAAALAASVASAPSETTAAPAPSVPVFLGGKELFRVRASRKGLTPEARAAAIRARLTDAVKDSSVSADSVRLIATPDGIQVQLGPRFLWLITVGDVSGSDPAKLEAMLTQLPHQIRDGIKREREGRKPARVAVSIAIALALTLVALTMLRLLVAGTRKWRKWLERTLANRIPAIRVRNFDLVPKAQVTGVVIEVLSGLGLVVGVVILYAYFTTVFSLFPWTQGWSSILGSFALAQVMKLLKSIASALPGLFLVALILLLFRWLNVLAGRVFDAIGDGRLVLGSFHPELAAPSRRIVAALLWVIAIMVAYPYIPGSGSKAVQSVSLLFGLVVSLGSSGIVGNAIAGIVLTYTRSFSVGDLVRIGDQIGKVMHLGIFVTRLRTIRNEEITIPNGAIAATTILNYTRNSGDIGLVLHTQVTIGYDADWRTVHGLLIEAALKVTGIEKKPEPWVWQRTLNDFHITYELNCITHDSLSQLRLYSQLHAEIQDAFSRAGVEILSPGYNAIRDANKDVLPKEPQGPRHSPGGFRIAPSE